MLRELGFENKLQFSCRRHGFLIVQYLNQTNKTNPTAERFCGSCQNLWLSSVVYDIVVYAIVKETKFHPN